jgi:hypothetical protein
MDQLTKDILKTPVDLNALDVVNEIIANSGVYGDEVADPNELRQIADSGYGVFINFESGVIDFSRFRTPVPRTPDSESFGIFATNLNTVWRKSANGQAVLESDSDADGLSDYEELEFQARNLAPALSELNPDSDGNGLGDGIEASYFKTPCVLSNCAKPAKNQDVRRPVTCDFIPEDEGEATGYFAKDILNNCEKIVSHANYRNFSAIWDKIPDGVKVRNGIAPKDDTLNNPDPENDNLTTLQELMSNLPWWFPGAIKSGYKPTQYNPKFIGLKDNRSCYSFSIRDLPYKEIAVPPGADAVAGTFNKVRVWLTQSDRDLRDYMRYADVLVSPGQPLRLTDEDFK